MESIIGNEIEILDDNAEVIKSVTILKEKETKLGTLFYGSDGEWYTEDELNLKYTLTPEGILYLALENSGIKAPFNYEQYHEAFKMLMELLEKAGYISKDKK